MNEIKGFDDSFGEEELKRNLTTPVRNPDYFQFLTSATTRHKFVPNSSKHVQKIFFF